MSKIVLTPLQRFHLANLFLNTQKKIPDAATGRAFRSAFKALGLKLIIDTADEYNGELSSKQLLSKDPSVFELHQAQAQYIVDKVLTEERDIKVDLILGDIFDTVEDIASNKDIQIFDSITTFDPSTENWTPPEKDIKGQLIAAMALMANIPLANRKETWRKLCEKFTINKLQETLDSIIDEIRASIAE